MPFDLWYVKPIIAKILSDEAFAASLAALGIEAAPTTPEGLRNFVISETNKWSEIAKAAGIQKE